MAHDEVPLDDNPGHTVEHDGHDWTVAFRPELKGVVLARPHDMATALDLLRRGALHPQPTPDMVRNAPYPASPETAAIEIAYVEALLEGVFAAQLEVKLIVAYRVRLAALRRYLEGMAGESTASSASKPRKT
jgi:hypothetical protein